jgi:hypothetical protein
MPDDQSGQTPGPSWSRPMTGSALAPGTAAEAEPVVLGDDDALRQMVNHLARRHPSGGTVIERAAILATGAEASRLVAWIIAHGGQPEAAAVRATQGLHGPRLEDPGGTGRPPARYVLPAGALS